MLRRKTRDFLLNSNSPHPATLLEPAPSKSIFTPEELSLLNLSKSPTHVAIIMDGNRRWAKQRGLPSTMGHWEGAEVLIDVVKAAAELNIKTLTVYSFSTENWTRPTPEIETLMNIFEVYLTQKKELMIREGIRLETIGDLSRLPASVQEAFYKTKNATNHCRRVNLVLALNYGARDEIRRAMLGILKENIAPENLTEECIARHLDTHQWGDPDLLIRTSGELRISNFLLWQISYSELYMTDVLWPDFSPRHLYEATLTFQERNRRRGT